MKRAFIATATATAMIAALAIAFLPGTAMATATSCTQTGFIRDGINMTAAQIGGNVTGTLDAGGCNIGVYYGPLYDTSNVLTGFAPSGNVTGADIFDANYFGVVVNGDAGAVTVNVTGSTIHDIGESPLDGTQHGVAIYYRALSTGTASGTISGNTLTNYQKGGISVSGAGVSATIKNNIVTGLGRVSYIAQNGIQVGYGAKATVTGNTVTGNAYTGAGQTSSAGILVVGGTCYSLPFTTGLVISKNTLTNNDVGVWLFNCGAGTTKTNNSVKLNTITNDAVTNTTGYSATCGYQAGVADVGHRDAIVNNKISGVGYTPVPGDCDGTPSAFVRHVDTDSSARALPSNK
ncbi:MAG: right-handed parallel beta-helix repeat-containing protein [Actinomycetota bacterium]|nr:right-handed parallel beta-helix repeat-containing protein [Actinomycetota bacterium]